MASEGRGNGDRGSHFVRIASHPRPAGSSGAANARQYCATVLGRAGFDVREFEFSYSAVPGILGTPIVGLVAAMSITAAARLGLIGHPCAATVTIAIAMAVIVAGTRWLARKGILTCSLLRRRGVNLEAVRGTAEPRVWLVAHIDSKWQPVPTLVRATSTVMLGATMVAALFIATAEWLGFEATSAWTAVEIIGWITALPVIASVVGGRSNGAVDNASGVATVLTAAELVPGAAPIGVLITDAEELGLVGARVWAESRRPGTALNCDGIDDIGRATVMCSGSKPLRVIAAFERAASGMAEPLRVMRVLPGILTDGVALSDAGWEAVTLSRGSMRTLSRIHTMSDSVARMRGSEIDRAARLLAGAAMELI